MNLADDLPNVQADHVQLLQVVLNLIMNASDAMSQVALDQREILISASYCHDTARVMLLVADSGPRLNPDTIEHMIEPFFTTKESGLGLGLTICQSIVTAHGGQLSVRANPDRGVTVSVSLPSHTARAARGPANQAV
jgi:C4-dicarboxylate-specific signal transduction histidine kinase